MRVLRVVVGMLTLLLAIPVLATGAAAWWLMQHRSADGSFHATVEPIESRSRVVVVPDVDALLRGDASFARIGRTELRLKTAAPAFIGIAAPADVAAYLAGVGYTEIQEARIGRGPLLARTKLVEGTGVRPTAPELQAFWQRQGTGDLAWSPSADRGRKLALVIVSVGDAPLRLDVEVSASWFTSTTWGLLIIGPVLLLLGFAALAWPQRPQEVVYVTGPGAALPPAARASLAGVPAQFAWDAPLTLVARPAGVAQPTRGGIPDEARLTLPGAGTGGWGAPGGGRNAARWAASPPVPDGLVWPLPQAGPAVTAPARDVPTLELRRTGPDLPMPIVGLRFEQAHTPR